MNDVEILNQIIEEQSIEIKRLFKENEILKKNKPVDEVEHENIDAYIRWLNSGEENENGYSSERLAKAYEEDKYIEEELQDKSHLRIIK